MVETKNTQKAFSALKSLSQCSVTVKPISEADIPGFENFLGITKVEDDTITIYVSEKYPEAMLIHEILHIVLRHEGFPTIRINQYLVSKHLPESIHNVFLLLQGRIVSTIDHPEIHRRMKAEYDLDLDEYFRIETGHEIAKIIAEGHGSKVIDSNDDYIFTCQQHLLSGIDFMFWGKHSLELLETLGYYFPNVLNSCKALYKKINAADFAVPGEVYESARIILNHIITYGKKNLIKRDYSLLWESLEIIKIA